MKAVSLLLILAGCAGYERKISDHPIQGPLEARYESYRQCYLESEIYKGPNNTPPGGMKIKFLINETGKVTTAMIQENTMPKDPNFEACVLGQIKVIQFPEVKAVTEVIQPLNFLPVKQ